MQEHIEFNPSYTLLTLACNAGEAVNVEPGAMVSLSGMTMQTGMSGGGGFGGSRRFWEVRELMVKVHISSNIRRHTFFYQELHASFWEVLGG